jgi:hypothetical protein
VRIRPSHYWRRQLREVRPEAIAAPACDARGTIAMLSAAPQKALGWFSRFLAFLTTPFKFLGISGWKETGCGSEGRGRPVRDAQHSTDGFWTIDVRLEELAIGGAPGNRIATTTDLAFGGAVVIDTDGPFLEVHPEEDFRLLP